MPGPSGKHEWKRRASEAKEQFHPQIAHLDDNDDEMGERPSVSSTASAPNSERTSPMTQSLEMTHSPGPMSDEEDELDEDPPARARSVIRQPVAFGQTTSSAFAASLAWPRPAAERSQSTATASPAPPPPPLPTGSVQAQSQPPSAPQQRNTPSTSAERPPSAPPTRPSAQTPRPLSAAAQNPPAPPPASSAASTPRPRPKLPTSAKPAGQPNFDAAAARYLASFESRAKEQQRAAAAPPPAPGSGSGPWPAAPSSAPPFAQPPAPAEAPAPAPTPGSAPVSLPAPVPPLAPARPPLSHRPPSPMSVRDPQLMAIDSDSSSSGSRSSMSPAMSHLPKIAPAPGPVSAMMSGHPDAMDPASVPRARPRKDPSRPRAARKHFNDNFQEQTSRFRLQGYEHDNKMSAGETLNDGASPYGSINLELGNVATSVGTFTGKPSHPALGRGRPAVLVHDSAGGGLAGRSQQETEELERGRRRIEQRREQRRRESGATMDPEPQPPMQPSPFTRQPQPPFRSQAPAQIPLHSVAPQDWRDSASPGPYTAPPAEDVQMGEPEWGRPLAGMPHAPASAPAATSAARQFDVPVAAPRRQYSGYTDPSHSPEQWDMTPPPPGPPFRARGASNASQHAPHPMKPAPPPQYTAPPPEPSKKRIVNLLIQDRRRGDESSYEYAEVRIAMRPADEDEEPGFWVDAKDVAEALQSSPGRIDGPAKVYCMRGKYRQYFLRVSANNEDHCMPFNLLASTRRILDVFVEPLVPAHLPVAPPPAAYAQNQIKPRRASVREDSPPPTPPSAILSPSPYSVDFTPATSANLPQKRRSPANMEASYTTYPKSQTSSSTYSHGDAYDDDDDIPSPPPQAKRPRHDSYYTQASQPRTVSSSARRDDYYHPGSGSRAPAPSLASPPSYSDEYTYPPPPRMQPAEDARSGSSRRAPSPRSTESSSRHAPSPRISEPGGANPRPPAAPTADEAIVEYIKPMVEDDDMWPEYIKSTAMPRTVPEILRQFYFIAKHIKHFETRTTPPTLLNAPSTPIERRHVMAVLELPESLADQVMLICEQHRLYGRHGLRYEDSRVVQMADAEMSPDMRITGREMHNFAVLLAEIGSKWMADHPEDRGRPPDSGKAGRKNKKLKVKERQ